MTILEKGKKADCIWMDLEVFLFRFDEEATQSIDKCTNKVLPSQLGL